MISTLVAIAAFLYYVTHGAGILSAVIAAVIVMVAVEIVMRIIGTIFGVAIAGAVGIASLFRRDR